MEHMYFLVRILFIWLLCLLSVFFHELGHALGYRISTGKAKWKVIAGSEPGMFRTSRTIFCLIPAGGYFIPGEEAGTNKAKIITLAGGPCVSLMHAILYGIIHFCIPEFIQPGSSLYRNVAHCGRRVSDDRKKGFRNQGNKAYLASVRDRSSRFCGAKFHPGKDWHFRRRIESWDSDQNRSCSCYGMADRFCQREKR